METYSNILADYDAIKNRLCIFALLGFHGLGSSSRVARYFDLAHL